MRSAAVAAVLLAALPAQDPPALPPLSAAMDKATAALRLRGAGLAVVRDTGVVHQSLHGGLGASEPVPIASASKWLGVATILTLVDEGKLDLDTPVSRYVAEFDRAAHSTLTLRQCLSCTGGLPARLGRSVRGMDMQEFAAAAADTSLRDNPGAAFVYGGVGFQVAAVAAERVTGKSWHELFVARIAVPVGLSNTRFGALQPVGSEAGTTPLPWIAGGAVSTLADYARFVRMLIGKGEIDGRRVLSAESVAAMLRDQVRPEVAVRAVGFDGDDVRYGLGTWIERLADGAERVSDPGAFGWTPWIDLDLGVGGVFAVRDRVGRVMPHVRSVQEAVRAAAASPLVAGTDTTVTLPHGGRDRRYHLHVPAAPQPGANGSGSPLVLVLHGGGGNGAQVRETTGFAALSDRAGFVVAFPDGTGPLRGSLLTWNSGGIKVHAAEHDVDDVGFLREVVRDVQRKVAIDPDRVFVVGHSNGGMMCHRLAREAADVFAGIAVVAGAMNFTEVQATSPIAALIVHGTADERVLHAGGRPKVAVGRSGDREDASVQAAVDYYVARNGLRAYPETTTDGDVRIDDYAVARAGQPGALPVRVITLDGGGHAWPGAAEKTRAKADVPFPFDATGAVWQFFATVRRPAREPAPGR